jgi:hypothetical protein
MPGDPKACREHSKCCLQLAAESKSPLAKAQFENLAQTWLRLATDLERAKALVKHWGVDNKKDRTG